MHVGAASLSIGKDPRPPAPQFGRMEKHLPVLEVAVAILDSTTCFVQLLCQLAASPQVLGSVHTWLHCNLKRRHGYKSRKRAACLLGTYVRV